MTGRHFDAPSSVAGYHANLDANVPGLPVLKRLTDQLLSETVPDAGRLLVVGAGGGAEIAHLASGHPGWRFDGVDPSAPMLELAAQTLGERAASTNLINGYVHDAPDGPFDAATCLLVLHFLSLQERRSTLAEIHRRLRPGAPLVALHHSVPAGPARERWFRRSAAWALGAEGDPEQIQQRATGLATKLPAVTPEEDQQVLSDAGFREVEVFYSALSRRGWIAYA